MAHAHTRRLIDTWRRSRHGDALPARTAVRPEALGPLLPQLFVLGQEEAEPGAPWRFRLAGGFVRDLFGRDLRGAGFPELWAPVDRPSVLAALDRARRAGDPAVLGALAGEGAHALRLEVTLAPATGPLQRPDRVIGLVQPTDLVSLRLSDRPAATLRLAREEPSAGPRLVVDNTDPDAGLS